MQKAIVFILSCALVLIYGCNSLVKEKQNTDFTGIYEFEIDKTTVNDLSKLPYHFKEMTVKNAITDIINKKGIDSVTYWGLLVDGVRKFSIDDFTKDGIKQTDVTLFFYHDTLYLFRSIPDYEIINILKTEHPKYREGKWQIDWDNNIIRAFYHFGGQELQLLFIGDSKKYWQISHQTRIAEDNYRKKM